MVQDQSGDNRLRRGMWEIFKGSLEEVDSKKRKTDAGIGIGKLHGHKSAGCSLSN